MATEKQSGTRKARGSAGPVLQGQYPKDGYVRAHFDIDRELHKALKIFAINHGETMRDVVERALEKEIRPRR